MDQEEFFTSPLKGYLTMRDMAAALGVSFAVVKRAIDRSHLPPVKRHGVVRLWGAEQLADLRTMVEPTATPKSP